MRPVKTSVPVHARVVPFVPAHQPFVTGKCTGRCRSRDDPDVAAASDRAGEVPGTRGGEHSPLVAASVRPPLAGIRVTSLTLCHAAVAARRPR